MPGPPGIPGRGGIPGCGMPGAGRHAGTGAVAPCRERRGLQRRAGAWGRRGGTTPGHAGGGRRGEGERRPEAPAPASPARGGRGAGGAAGAAIGAGPVDTGA